MRPLSNPGPRFFQLNQSGVAESSDSHGGAIAPTCCFGSTAAVCGDLMRFYVLLKGFSPSNRVNPPGTSFCHQRTLPQLNSVHMVLTLFLGEVCSAKRQLHPRGLECKSVLSTGVDSMFVGNRIGVGLTRSTSRSFAPIYISHQGSEIKLSSWW